MTKIEYLLSLSEKGDSKSLAEIRDTWVALGSQVATNKTKIYLKDSLFKVKCNVPEDECDCDEEERPELDGTLIYCTSQYSVSDKWPEIEWEGMKREDVNGIIGSWQGVATPFFKIVLSREQMEKIDIPTKDIIPFANITSKTEVQIDDDELTIILSEAGCPFIRIDELELGRDEICKYCIKPAMDDYFGYFPIVRDDQISTQCTTFEKELPEDAYYAIPYYIVGTMGSGERHTSPFAYFNEQYIWGGSQAGFGSPYGNGLRYNKGMEVGYTGIGGGPTFIDARASSQGMINYFRRESYRIFKKEDGKKYVKGYSTIGGTVCVKWLCVSYNFDDIDFSLRGDFRKLATSYVLRNLGSLRSLVKTDLPGAIDFSTYLSRSTELQSQVIDKWKASPTSMKFAIMRGNG